MNARATIGLFIITLAAIAAPTILRAGGSASPETIRAVNTAQTSAGDKSTGVLTAAAQTPKPAAPYAGQQTRDIKALSEDEVSGLLSGAGLGFAKAAELNHYPGPVHVIALAGQLGLTPEQSARTKTLYQSMKRQAVPLGEKILAREKHLDTLFASGAITEDSLRAATSGIGRLRGELRAVHLSYHLKMKTLLTSAQVAAYDRLRGYEPGSGPSGGAGNQDQHGGHRH